MQGGGHGHRSESEAAQFGPGTVRRDTGYLTTQQGVRVDHTDDSLTVGERGPTLLEDFHARETITYFDHERIPERVVHARGAGAHGYFEPYDDGLADYTAAKFLTTPGVQLVAEADEFKFDSICSARPKSSPRNRFRFARWARWC